MRKKERADDELRRLPTGVPGLDEVTAGGFLRAGVYIFQGAPGAGKTILANQVAHAHAAAGGTVVYVTMLAESHARLLQHIGGFSFFQPSAVPEQIYYISGFQALRDEGLRGVVNLLRQEMRTRKAGLVVLDGLVMAATAAASEQDLKLFVSEIQAHSALTGCTTLLLTSEQADRPVTPEQTMVDGIVLLRERAFGPRRQRQIEVVKFRGSPTLRGSHAFDIGPAGIVVYPRLEAARRISGEDAVRPEAIPSGVAGLDRLFLLGGYPRGSVVVVSGVAGSGKTLLALHYLAAARAREKALFVGFYESPELLARIAEMAGLAQPGGFGRHVEFVWLPFGEMGLDEVAANILERVRRLGATRLVIDGMGGLMAATGFQERGAPFLAAFGNELRRTGVTTFTTVEQQDASRALALDSATLSSLSDVQLDIQLHTDDVTRRFISVRKNRLSLFRRERCEIVLTGEGLAVLEPGATGGR